MSKWFPAVDTVEGAREGAKAGVFGALAFAAMNGLGLAFLLIAGHMPKESAPTDEISSAIGIVVEIIFVLICAWRFRQERGLFIGLFTTGLFAVEIFNKVVTGTTNVGWILFYAAVTAGLVNGLRGAWALRGFRKEEPSQFQTDPLP